MDIHTKEIAGVLDFQIDTNNKEFQEALQLITFTRQALFLTGKAGTGKSTFLRYICEHTKKKHIVLAPTGIAAINARGSTIHSFFKLPFRPLLPDDPDLSPKNIFEFFKYTKAHRKIISEVELIIIDEISMVRADIIDCIDRILRAYSNVRNLPFGGKQLLLVGDVYQLEPVVAADQKEILGLFYPDPFFFSARVFREVNLVAIELQKNYRQTDAGFIHILDGIRNNTAGRAELQVLNSRFMPDFNPSNDDMYVTLATRRDKVDHINERKLEELPGDELICRGSIEGDFPESSLPTQLNLCIKEQSQVMFIDNDHNRRWVNGTIGVISRISEGLVYVLLESGVEHLVEKTTWRNYRYMYNEKEKRIEEEILGTFTQLPIRLAWAITIHKSQGLTFNRMVVDLTGGAFAGGQTYVALSRCTSLEGLALKVKISERDIFIRKEIVRFSQKFNDKQLFDEAIRASEAELLYAQAADAFRRGDMRAAVEALASATGKRNELHKPAIQRLISLKLQNINSLKAQIKQLNESLHQQKATQREYAREYYLMGNECIIKAKDPSAAIRNFDKALKLDPTMVDAWVRKGITLFDYGNAFDAQACFNEAVRLSPLSFSAHYNRGKCLLTLKHYEEALADFDKAIARRPDHPAAHEFLAEAYKLLGNEEQAEHHRDLAQRLRRKK